MGICDEVEKEILEPLQIMDRGPDTGEVDLTGHGPLPQAKSFNWEEYQEEGEDILGEYIPMHSPGHIRLYTPKLDGFFWHIIDRMNRQGYSFWEDDLEKLVHMAVGKTYWHEHFHLFSDVMEHLHPGFQHRRDPEEALAVAFSYLTICEKREKWNSRIGRIPTNLYTEFINQAFSYRAHPYRDWDRYTEKDRFKRALLDYIDPPQSGELHANGIPVEDMLYVQLQTVWDFQKIETRE